MHSKPIHDLDDGLKLKMDYHKYTLRHIHSMHLFNIVCIATWNIDFNFSPKKTYIILVILIKINMKSTTNYRH